MPNKSRKEKSEREKEKKRKKKEEKRREESRKIIKLKQAVDNYETDSHMCINTNVAHE